MSSEHKEKLGFRKGMALAFLNIASLEAHFDKLVDFVITKGVHILGYICNIALCMQAMLHIQARP